MKHLDLFSGKGTFVESAERIFSDYECAGMCEVDPYAQRLLRGKFPHVPLYEDIRTLEPSGLGKIDIVTGGFPCQDISIAKGKNANGLLGSQSGLWYEMLRICRILRPSIIVIENTPALRRRGLDTILANLASERYDAVWTVLSAAQFGYAHRRKRIFITAFNTDRIGREEIYLYARTITEISQQEEIRGKNLQQFGRLSCEGFWREDYAEFLRMDNEYPCTINSSRLKIIGNSIIAECTDTILQSLSPIISNL